jgi:hypothetical protein
MGLVPCGSATPLATDMSPTQEAAMRMALEALEGKRFTACGWRTDCDVAITALKAALAEPNADYPCRGDGRCQYAIDSGAEGLGHCPKGKCVMVRHLQPPEDIAVARNNLEVMRQMFPEYFGEQAHHIK